MIFFIGQVVIDLMLVTTVSLCLVYVDWTVEMLAGYSSAAMAMVGECCAKSYFMKYCLLNIVFRARHLFSDRDPVLHL